MGALDHRRRGLGGAPRFRSAHVRLTAAATRRATFCFPDSFFEPTRLATADRFDLIPLADAFDARPLTDHLEATEGGVLDDYIEAHVHGVVRIDELSRHPDFRGPAIVEVGHRVAQKGLLDARIISVAVAQGREDPQDLKKVWHHVARFGAPVASRP